MPVGILSEATSVRPPSRRGFPDTSQCPGGPVSLQSAPSFKDDSISSPADASLAVSTGEARSDSNELACWAVALQPCSAKGRKRVRVSLVVCLPQASGEFQEACPSLIWGVASSGHTSWHEPPPGWSTEPDNSWDVGPGAWGTESAEVEPIRIGNAEVPVYSVVMDLPWSGALRKRNGIAFKWRWPCGKQHMWFGDANTGRNLSVRTSFAKVVLAPTDSDGVPPDTARPSPRLYAWQTRPVDRHSISSLHRHSS